MTKHLLALVAVGLLVVAFLPAPAAPPAPAPKSPVAKALDSATRQDHARVAAFYSALADVLERDSALILTTGLFRTVHANSLDLAFKGTDLPGKYQGLDKAINDALVAAVKELDPASTGLENVALTAERKAALVAALKEIADAAR